MVSNTCDHSCCQNKNIFKMRYRLIRRHTTAMVSPIKPGIHNLRSKHTLADIPVRKQYPNAGKYIIQVMDSFFKMGFRERVKNASIIRLAVTNQLIKFVNGIPEYLPLFFQIQRPSWAATGSPTRSKNVTSKAVSSIRCQECLRDNPTMMSFACQNPDSALSGLSGQRQYWVRLCPYKNIDQTTSPFLFQ